MDLTFIIVLWVIVSIIEAVSSRKKAPPPSQIPPQDSTGIDFEIPTLANDPHRAAEVQEINLSELYRQKKQAAQNFTATNAKSETKNFVEEENKNIEVNLDSESAMNAIILSEILDKPKSLRRKKF